MASPSPSASRVRVTDAMLGRLWRAAVSPAPHTILDGMADAVFVADASRRLAYLNRTAQQMTGWTGHEALGRPISQFVDHDDTLELPGCQPCQIVLRSGRRRPAEATITRLHEDSGTTPALILVCRDIGPALALSAVLSHRAEHDALTDLPNRDCLRRRLGTAVLDATATRSTLAVGFLDVDGMKRVNDTLGHAAGDELLVACARRLAAAVRHVDMVARLGGDEFVVLLPRVDAVSADEVMRALLVTLGAPYEVAGQAVRVSVSAGLAVCPDHGVTPSQLLAAADQAMYRAKHAGGGMVRAHG